MIYVYYIIYVRGNMSIATRKIGKNCLLPPGSTHRVSGFMGEMLNSNVGIPTSTSRVYYSGIQL